MSRSYIVAAMEAAKSREIARQIAGLPGIKMTSACWGSRDVFAIVEIGGMLELNGIGSFVAA